MIYPDLPELALSIRQPWAWAILNAGKDIENRSWPTWKHGRICIHASKGLTRAEYEDFIFTVHDMSREHEFPSNLTVPRLEDMQRGGIVGTVEIAGCVESSKSPWFFGRYGFVLKQVFPVPFIPVSGALGFFKWREKLI